MKSKNMEKKIKPIVKYLTDSDLYKFSMMVAVLNCFPRARVRYKFVDRSNRVYPIGFAEELRKQVDYLADVVITEEEIQFMQRKCYYFPNWFYTFLRGYRFDPSVVNISQDAEGHLEIWFEGYWWKTILFEVMLLAIVSELYYIMMNIADKFDQDAYFEHTYDKAVRLLSTGCCVSEFGTRRRSSFETQETVIKAFLKAKEDLGPNATGKFAGTSNVYLAMKYDLTPIGTMAHEWVSAIAGIYGPQEANHIAMEMWQKTFGGSLGTYLYDTYGWDAFEKNFSEHYARVFAGLRVDSGDNYEQYRNIISKYEKLGIDPSTKQITFSNALDTETAVEIQRSCNKCCIPQFGIGTHLTNDWGWLLSYATPLNIVIKLVAVAVTEKREMNDTCKMSEDLGKYTGKPSCVFRFKQMLGQPVDEKLFRAAMVEIAEETGYNINKQV